MARTDGDAAAIILADLERALDGAPRRPFVLGISGAQGAGKSTIARSLTARLKAAGLSAAQISLDDFYLSRAERRRLASSVHPLFVTRGPPGTHDLDAALSVLAAVRAGQAMTAPRFDKARDEPRPLTEGTLLPAGLDVLIFEGWCLGARAEDASALIGPVNMLERNFDPDGVWRRAANDALAGRYRLLFREIDRLVFLRAPSFDIVQRWRAEQEHALSRAPRRRVAPGLMTAEEISFFIQHFERLTRWMMEDLPGAAHLTLQLDERRRVMMRSLEPGAFRKWPAYAGGTDREERW